ncbi:type II membrane protein [Serpula lacrymans var. lacrymans S7.3]|uniref:Autophagy-related protein 27 n=1 Tax=Serpula lacrymans var. lacrymans (strain S7.3) TaxID=936435 RepID=F8PUV6_SERL3|nr:type II membrane protein [Serpula lacrymans var. lacrymans S7.3]
MILRRQLNTNMTLFPFHLFALFLVLSSALVATAQDKESNPFDCHVTIDSLEFDLTALAGVHTVSRIRETPPTSMIDQVRFNLCDDLQTLDGVEEGDQCPSGTRACMTKTNKKGDDSDRIVAVIPVAQSSLLKPETSVISSPSGLSLTFHGSSYPNTTSPPSIPQSFKLSLFCASSLGEPVFSSYNDGQVQVDWSAPSGCSSTPDDKEPSPGNDDEDKKEKEEPQESVGSGLGFFFLVLLLAFIAYFALGAYYKYSTYGARGADLIPHRDFWKEVPYMLQDVVSHLCSAVRPRRSSRGGYIAV